MTALSRANLRERQQDVTRPKFAASTLKGVIVAAVTPFEADESIDEIALDAHLEFLVQSGVHGVLIIGGCGEYVNLTMEERKRVIEQSVAVINGRLPVIVGALSPGTRDATEVGQYAAAAGADALLVAPPYYIHPSTDGVREHLLRIGSATDLPIIAYNNPPRTGWSITPDALKELMTVPHVVGLKESERDLATIARKIAMAGADFPILSGDDDLSFPTLLCGAAGGIWATPNLAPQLFVDLYDACLRGDLETGLALYRRVVNLVEARRGPNHPGPLKELMSMAGHPVGLARAPLAVMTAGQRAQAQAALKIDRDAEVSSTAPPGVAVPGQPTPEDLR
jgi:4-hydroxy-tetrahydrodipicolinate synthase